jgi:hypothetical protein
MCFIHFGDEIDSISVWMGFVQVTLRIDATSERHQALLSVGSQQSGAMSALLSTIPISDLMDHHLSRALAEPGGRHYHDCSQPVQSFVVCDVWPSGREPLLKCRFPLDLDYGTT